MAGTRGRIARAAGAMSAATLLSRVLGYGRDMVIAFYLGATGLSDAFFVSFRIPNLLRELLAEGSMASAFVPVLSKRQHSQGPQEANRLVQVVLGFVLVAVGLLCLLGIALAPLAVAAVAPGFLDEPEKFSLAVLLTRVMFPFLLLVSLSSVLMGALNTRGVFFLPALAPALLNAVVITSVLVLAPGMPNPALAAAVGITLGGLAQVLLQCPSALRRGYSLRPLWQPAHPGLREIGLLVLPAVFAMAAGQLNVVVSSVLASFLPEGSITYLFYAFRLVHFPIGVFGVAMAVAALPTLSRHAAGRDFAALREDFSFSLRVLLFLSIPAMAGLIALRVPIVSTLFYRGRFDWAATQGTADALLLYALGVWAMVGLRLLNAAFYALGDTRSPVRGAAASVGANLALSLLLMGPLGYKGLALAGALAATVNFTLLGRMLIRRLQGLRWGAMLGSALKSLLASALMALAAVLLASRGPWGLAGHGPQKALWLTVCVALSIGIYALVCYLLRSEELHYIIKRFKERRQ